MNSGLHVVIKNASKQKKCISFRNNQSFCVKARNESVSRSVLIPQMKMKEESLAIDMQKFAYKPKETLRPGSWYLL